MHTLKIVQVYLPSLANGADLVEYNYYFTTKYAEKCRQYSISWHMVQIECS